MTTATFCECGCGQLIQASDGRSRRFLKGHATRLTGHALEDRGFNTPCWIPPHTPQPSGYVRVKIAGKLVALHRLNFERRYGSIPSDKVVDHACGQRDCCNPDHLRLATAAENARNRPTARLTLDIAHG